MTLKTGYLEKRSDEWKSTSLFSEVSGVFATILENQGESLPLFFWATKKEREVPWTGRTNNRRRSPR